MNFVRNDAPNTAFCCGLFVVVFLRRVDRRPPAMAKKKGGGKKGGKKGAALPTTLAVGGVLMGNNPPSNFPLYKNPPVHRPVPVLMPSSPGRHRMPPAPPRLPIAVVRAASNGDVPAITGWLAASGSIDATWDSPMDHNVRGFTLLMLACLRGHQLGTARWTTMCVASRC